MSSTRRTDATGDDIALVIEAMCQIAAEPDRWDQLIDALGDAEPFDVAPPAIKAGLAQSQEIARLVGRGDAPQVSAAEPAWLILSSRKRVVAASPGAAEVLADGLGQLTLGAPLRFDDPENGWVLDHAIERARGDGADQTILRLERGEDLGPCFAYLASATGLGDLATLAEGADLESSFALIFPPAEEAGRLWTNLQDSFGLTAAEVRLARRLRDGRTLKEAADELDVSINTVRNQLRAIFDKMGLKRQSDLVRALAELSQVARVMEASQPEPQPPGFAPPLRRLTLSDGRRLAYRVYGDPRGWPVMMFHEGLGSSLLPPDLDRYAAGRGMQMICADRPGFGQSDPHPEYSFDNVARDMVELSDHLRLERLDICAMLSGAPSGLQTAIRLGRRVRDVIVLSGRPPRPAGRHGPDDPVNLFRTRIESHPWVIDTLYSIFRLRLASGLVPRFIRSSIAKSPGDQAYIAAHPEGIDYVASYVREALAETTQGPSDEIKTFRRAQNMTLDGLTARLRIWHGEEDEFAPLPALKEFVGDRADEIRLFPGTGHMLALREWRTVLDDLAGQPRD